MLTSKQRAYLKGRANGLDTIVQIGKNGVEPAVSKQVADALASRELIKGRVLENSPYTPREAAAELAEYTKSEVVQVIGTKFVLFKQKKKDSAYTL